jgi:hypothetical protein
MATEYRNKGLCQKTSPNITTGLQAWAIEQALRVMTGNETEAQ